MCGAYVCLSQNIDSPYRTQRGSQKCPTGKEKQHIIWAVNKSEIYIYIPTLKALQAQWIRIS